MVLGGKTRRSRRGARRTSRPAVHVAPGETEAMPRIWTVGHGARPLDELLALLREHGIATLADVRSFPGSRRHPQFGREPLAVALSAAGIAYVHIGELGGRRREAAAAPTRGGGADRRREPHADPGAARASSPGARPSRHTAIRVAAFRAYADHMGTDEFRAGLARLQELARGAPAAYMCAETLWWRCHRRMLSDRLAVDGWDVIHILAPGKTEPHRLWDAARVEDGRIVYDRDDRPGQALPAGTTDP